MSKKIAVFHNFLDNIGGAEIVALTLARELHADIYTTNIDEKNIVKMGFADILPRVYSIGSVPKKAPWKQQAAFYRFRKLNLKGKYDMFIIAGDWAMSAAVNNKPNIWYVHSPLNQLWAFKRYAQKAFMPFWKIPFFDLWVRINRMLSIRYAQHVQTWLCNSQNTQKRIKKYYHHNAVIINPPIYSKTYASRPAKNYWLSVNRILKTKRIEMQVEAFAHLPREKLILVGSYEKNVHPFEEYKMYIEQIKPKNVIIKSWVDDAQLKQLYAECKGFIATAKDEDFGMTPVEAMASGKPVIAADEGGYRETVLNGKTGVRIPNITAQKLAHCIEDVSTKLKAHPQTYVHVCRRHAATFDTTAFVKKIKKFL